MPIKSFNKIWQLSLFSFLIAALTGFLYRFGMLYPLPEWLNFANIRHAHSHLMFFNWVSPPIMICMVSRVLPPSRKDETKKFMCCFYVMLFLGFLSWPFFLLYGYHSVSIGSASLPLAAIISGLVMINWYWFAWLYYKQRKKADISIPSLFFDGALTALLLSTLGAWGVSIFQFTPADSPQVSSAMTHFFLAVFTEGWTVLGILGIIWHHIKAKKIPFSTSWLWQPILFGSLLIFPFSLSESVITPAMHYTAKLGALLIASSLALNLYLFIKSGWFKGFIWNTLLFLISIKTLFQFAVIFPTDIWPGEHGLRVLYLHIILLGILSILLVNVFHPKKMQFSKLSFAGAVLLILISLTMISGYWPHAFTPADLYFWVLILAFLPVLPMAWILLRSFQAADQ